MLRLTHFRVVPTVTLRNMLIFSVPTVKRRQIHTQSYEQNLESNILNVVVNIFIVN